LLARAIIRSRFPGDTGAARLRQLAMVIHSEHMRRAPPTVTSLAMLVESHRSLIDALISTLQERDLVSKTDALGYQPTGIPLAYAQRNTVIDIRTDALEAFEAAHLRETEQKLVLDDAFIIARAAAAVDEAR
jgi:DNA-binding IclR family transcriptional regulator